MLIGQAYSLLCTLHCGPATLYHWKVVLAQPVEHLRLENIKNNTVGLSSPKTSKENIASWRGYLYIYLFQLTRQLIQPTRGQTPPPSPHYLNTADTGPNCALCRAQTVENIRRLCQSAWHCALLERYHLSHGVGNTTARVSNTTECTVYQYIQVSGRLYFTISTRLLQSTLLKLFSENSSGSDAYQIIQAEYCSSENYFYSMPIQLTQTALTSTDVSNVSL